MATTPLIVFAHPDEAACFEQAGVPHLVTGVGKINATLTLTEALLRGEPGSISRVIVLGTAGAISANARLDTVYQIDEVLQHDFSLPSPTIVPAGKRVTPDAATIATGDVFVQDDAERAAIQALGAALVDMESYAYAVVCERFGVPLQLFKVPSDFADSTTTQDEWDGVVVSKSRQLFDFVAKHLPELLA